MNINKKGKTFHVPNLQCCQLEQWPWKNIEGWKNSLLVERSGEYELVVNYLEIYVTGKIFCYFE